MKLKKLLCLPNPSGNGHKVRKLGLLVVAAAAMTFASKLDAQNTPCPVAGDGIIFSQNYLPWPPDISEWQFDGVFNGVECKRHRVVVNEGCSDWVPDGTPEGRFANCNDFCYYQDHGIADFQEGIYVPGTGCTQWTATSYTWVSGDGSQTGQLIDATSPN